jgi:methyltransferase (TIGR00027 family)
VRAIKQPAIRMAVVLRTVAVDRLVLEAIPDLGCDAVVNLGAGLDTRAWRLDLPAALRWTDVDLPDLFDYKDAVMAGERPRCVHEQIRLDLADRSARVDLFERVARESRRALVVTEGLLSYLEPDMVARLADDLHSETSFVAWVTELTGNQVVRRLREAGDDIRPGDAKSRFAPVEGTAFFEPHGWSETAYLDLFLDSGKLGRMSISGRVLRCLLPLLPRNARANTQRGLGVVRLDRRG